MSWHFSQALVEAYSEANCLDGAPFALLKSKDSQETDSCNGKTKGILNRSQYGMMCEPSMGGLGAELLMWFLGASPAKISVLPGKAEVLKENEADCGGKCEGSFARYDHDLHLWKTAQCSLFGGLTEFSETWPNWGLMRTGECWAVAPSVPPMTAKERGCWLGTPTATMSQRSKKFLEGADRLPTPAELVGGVPNPEWIEWLMGWPIGQSGTTPLETDKFQSWLQQHGRF